MSKAKKEVLGMKVVRLQACPKNMVYIVNEETAKDWIRFDKFVKKMRKLSGKHGTK